MACPSLRVIEIALGGALDRVSDVVMRPDDTHYGVWFGVNSSLQVRAAPDI